MCLKRPIPLVALSLLLSTGVIGCGTGPTAIESDSPVAVTSDFPQVALAELLSKPRAELAKECEEMAAQVEIREKQHRDGSLAFGLLPRLRLPLILPIWAEATYSAKLEISLPPYIAEGTKDNALALHLARFGDAEAARRLVESGSDSVLKQIDDLACAKNYPAEWTRIVALRIHTAEYRLAMGEDEGRSELASLHRQLREVLDAKAAKSPLGAALLGQGFKVLTLAAAAWREHAQPELADKTDADLRAWGDCPAPAPAIPLGASNSEVADILRSTGKGRVVAALSTARALDVLSLPVTGEGVQSVIACFDGSERLAEVLVTYRPRIADYYLEPANLVLPLEDHGIRAADQPQTATVHRRQYTFNDWACEVAVVPRGYVLGAIARFSSSRSNSNPVSLKRDFGVVSLDRSFTQDRLRIAPEQIGEAVRTSRAKALAEVANPLAPLPAAAAELRRVPGLDLVEDFVLYYGGEENSATLFQAALPLWSAWGPSRFDAFDDATGGHLALIWEDDVTRYTLRVPHVSGQPFAFEGRDRRGPDSFAARAAAASTLDRTERRARIEAHKPQSRIPRRLDIGWPSAPGSVQLGASREKILQSLPRGQSILKLTAPGLLNVVFTGEAPRTATHLTRQVVIRFGPDERVTEIRVRTFDGPASISTARWTQEQYANLMRTAGAALESPGPSASLWSDLSAGKTSPILARWQDDISSLTFQRDGMGTETILRDCPLDQETGLQLGPLALLPRGPEGLALGEERDSLLRRFKIETPKTLPDGGVILPPVKGSAYDALLVWFEKDRLVRIVARQAPLTGGRGPTPSEQVTQSWARSIRSLGWPSRQDASAEGGLQGLGWHDDQTRIRIFWQESDEGPARVFTEWKEIPAPPQS
jgi:hypothetical protein